MSNADKVIHHYRKILVPEMEWEPWKDSRLIIPFTSGEKIGFLNSNGEIIVSPQYSMYYGECYTDNDYIRVVKPYIYGFQRQNGEIRTYTRPLYGLINFQGKEIIPVNKYNIIPSIDNKSLFTIVNNHNQYGVFSVIRKRGNTYKVREIVPFGIYGHIDGFDKGLSRVSERVIAENDNIAIRWGIINEEGKKVVLTEYSRIETFYNRDTSCTMATRGCKHKALYFDEIKANYKKYEEIRKQHQRENYPENNPYYCDTDIINEAFEGDPDALLNTE